MTAPPTAIASGRYQNPDDLLAALFRLPPAPFISMKPEAFVPSEGYEISMNGAGITNSRSRTPVLGTYGLASCMGIAVFNRSNGEGGVAHLAQGEDETDRLGATSRQALTSLLAAIRRDPSQQLEVRIVGPSNGISMEDAFIKDVLAIMNATPNLLFLSADFKGKAFPRAFGIDTRRWDEGLLKGSNSSGLNTMAIARSNSIEVTQRFMDGLKDVVEIANLPPAPDYDGNYLFDARSQFVDTHTKSGKGTRTPD